MAEKVSTAEKLVSTRAAETANKRMREQFLNVDFLAESGGARAWSARVSALSRMHLSYLHQHWNPLMPDKGLAVRLQDSERRLLYNNQARNDIQQIVTEAMRESILFYKQPFFSAILNDSLLSKDPVYPIQYQKNESIDVYNEFYKIGHRFGTWLKGKLF